MDLEHKNILLIISGGIAAYKSLELIRLLKKSGARIRCILTQGGSQFITPLSVSSLSGEKCYTDLWSLTDEAEMGHIRLAREADFVVIAPASADIIAKIAHGMANDLATTTLLASNSPVMLAPAMNPHMWSNAATRENVATLKKRGFQILSPNNGEMACGETGEGRMIEAAEILQSISDFFSKNKPLAGKKAIVTSGPTYEPIDPVRFIGNRSSGKQGHAIAIALRDAGASVTLVSGPTALPQPESMSVIQVETANQMNKAVQNALPADIAVCAAAVADYGVNAHSSKQKKKDGPLKIDMTENPDILANICNHRQRPEIVIGFAAETDHLIENAKQKLFKKGCDVIIANQVGHADKPVFGEDSTSVYWITKTEEETYNNFSKQEVASILLQKILKTLSKDTPS